MTLDTEQPSRTDGAGGGVRYVVTARWEGERWAVSVPSGRGGGRADTSAGTLAEAVTNASEVLGVLSGCRPRSVRGDIGIEVHVDAGMTERLQTASDPSETAEVLRGGGLRDDDISAIVGSQVAEALLPATQPGRAAAEAVRTGLGVGPAAGSRDGTEGP